MIRYALLLCAGLLAAACFACAQQQQAVFPPPPPTRLSATCRIDGKPFLNRVLFVQNGWRPAAIPPDDPPPGLGTSIDAHPNFAQNLENAFALASADFQDRLCGLKAIYVNGPSGCPTLGSCIGASWGYRAWKTRNKYVALSAGLWDLRCSSGPYLYHCFESDLLNLALDGKIADPSPPQYDPANREADNFDMTVLAALAHEVAHVVWYEAMNPGNPGSHGYNPGKFCNGTFFPNSWQTPINEPPRWRVFGQRSDDSHAFFPDTTNIDNAIDAGDWVTALGFVEQLYRTNQPWASYFASISPDEDFVETYKLIVLTSAQPVPALNEGPLTALPISLAAVPHNIPADYLAGSKTLLSIKTACVAPWIKPAP
jgi:hypothetical protein